MSTEADRLRLPDAEEDERLLHRRLTVFYGYFAVFAAVASIVTRWRVAIPFILEVQATHAVILAGVFLVLRFRVRDGALLRILDVVATVTTGATAAVTLSAVPPGIRVDVTAVSFFVLFFVVRAALVPSKPWIATVVAGVSAIPFTFGIAVMYRRAGVPSEATFAAIRAMVAGIVGVYVVSKTIYGLRSAVEKAVRKP
jgi:hypothetical protein